MVHYSQKLLCLCFFTTRKTCFVCFCVEFPITAPLQLLHSMRDTRVCKRCEDTWEAALGFVVIMKKTSNDLVDFLKHYRLTINERNNLALKAVAIHHVSFFGSQGASRCPTALDTTSHFHRSPHQRIRMHRQPSALQPSADSWEYALQESPLMNS